ncbi:DUF3800 domain-containing protein [Variovorax defluvii]
MSTFHVYADESCANDHRYMALGGVTLNSALVPDVLRRIKAVRDRHQTFGEVKWTKVSKSKLDFYREYVDVFFDASAADEMHFCALYVDTFTFNHHKYNGGQRDLGFNKLIYQLMLHKFGRRYGRSHDLHVYLDDRTTKHNPEQMRPMLNSDLAKWGINGQPFKRLHFRDSKGCDLIQLNDLLVGTVGFKRNLHDKVPGCAPHKIALGEHIVRRALQNEAPHRLNSAAARRFAVWPFRFGKG